MSTSTYAATVFHVSNETIRNWAEEFSRYLSFTANPGKGRTRSFSVEDLEVFALITEMKNKGSTFEEIHISLGKGQRGDAPDLLVDDVKAIISGEQERRLVLEVEYLKRTLQDALVRAQDAERIKEENIRLKAQLEAAQIRADQLLEQLRASISSQQATTAEVMQRVEELSKQIGESYIKGFLEALERKGEMPKKEG